jgi:putative Mg2+ transporter-C (MgtC) family protein
MHIPQDIFLKLALAVLAGGIIGIERELRSKSAGFRTMILICLGATLFTTFSQIIGVNGNPDRIASNVVVGIGFLGAGVIFKSENGVNGITTAATIWLTAALGMGIGSGYYWVALLAGAVVFIVLFMFSFFDEYLDQLNHVKQYVICYSESVTAGNKYETAAGKFRLKIKKKTLRRNGETVRESLLIVGNEKNHTQFIELLLKDSDILEFEC